MRTLEILQILYNEIIGFLPQNYYFEIVLSCQIVIISKFKVHYCFKLESTNSTNTKLWNYYSFHPQTTSLRLPDCDNIIVVCLCYYLFAVKFVRICGGIPAVQLDEQIPNFWA